MASGWVGCDDLLAENLSQTGDNLSGKLLMERFPHSSNPK
jgi:hypothetical protein